MNVSDYKCVIIQYTCDDCMIGNNFILVFNFNKNNDYKTEKGLCSHLDLTFHSRFDKGLFNCFIDFECKNCNEKATKTLVDDKTNDMMVNLNYKCKCGNGNINIGILFEHEIIDLPQNNEEANNGLNE